MPHSLPNIQRGTHTFATGHVTTSITLCANRQDPRVRCLRKKGPPGSRSSSLAPSPQCQCWQVGEPPGAIRLRKKSPFLYRGWSQHGNIEMGGSGGGLQEKNGCVHGGTFFSQTPVCHSPSRLRGSLRDRLSCSQPDVLRSSYIALPALDRVAENNYRNRVHATSSHFGGHMQFCIERIFIKRSMQFSPYGPDTPTNATPHHRVGW